MSESVAQEVLGITDPKQKLQAIKEAWQTLTGADVQESITELNGADLEEVARTNVERLADLRVIGEIILGDQIKTASTLVHWPMYASLMEDYGKKADGSARALQIGAYSAVSTRSFVCLARDVYGADQAVSVDLLAGQDKVRHGSFVCGSGLNLPIGSESMDFVHTNHLLQALIDPWSKSTLHTFSDQIRRLGSEMVRVLAPGGQLLMKEIAPWRQDQDPEVVLQNTIELSKNLSYSLAAAGMDRIVIEPSTEVRTAAHLFDPERNFANLNNTLLGGLRVYAQKSPLADTAQLQ